MVVGRQQEHLAAAESTTFMAARMATSVLPKPTSPQIRRSIGRGDSRSPFTASMARAWSSVSAYGKPPRAGA